MAQIKSRMPMNDVVRARIDTPTKEEAEAVLAAVGLTVSDALRLMLQRVVHEKKLPFEPLIPNEATIAAMRASLRGEVTRAGHPSKLFHALDAEGG